MTPQLGPGSSILFTGDSVTDCGRRQDADGHLGSGYVRAIASSGRVGGARTLAADYDAILVPADVELTRQAAELGAAALADGGVRPTGLGHARLAELRLDTVLGRP